MICSTESDWYSIGGGSINSGLFVASVVVVPGLPAGVVVAGVFTGEGALVAGVSVPPNENPEFLAAGVAVAGAGVADASLEASSVVLLPPKLNPADAVVVDASAGLEVWVLLQMRTLLLVDCFHYIKAIYC